MRKNKPDTKNKKRAQHIVELALVMPLMILLFSYSFVLMVETFSKYKFTYMFVNTVSNYLNFPVVLDSKEGIESAAKAHKIIENNLSNALQNVPFSSVKVESLETKNIVYLLATFKITSFLIFKNESHSSYFSFFLPVNKALIEPMLFNLNSAALSKSFETYYNSNLEQLPKSDVPPEVEENTDENNSGENNTDENNTDESNTGDNSDESNPPSNTGDYGEENAPVEDSDSQTGFEGALRG